MSKLTLLLIISALISVDLQAKDVENMEQLLAGLKNDVIMYCKDINLNAEDVEAVKEAQNSINNGNKNSPYRLNNSNMVEESIGSISQQTPQECYNAQTTILDNVFKEYYKKISEEEFVVCYNSTSDDSKGVLGFEDCIEDIKKKECAPILNEKFENVFDRAKKYKKCLSS